ENQPYARPGNWNDPDMLIVGWVGWGPSLHPTRLSPDEQYTHISLWSLLSSPLLIGCDLERLDAFTLNLLTNDEVIAVNQDLLGVQARQVTVDGDIQVWVKPLADGGQAFGVFNLGDKTANYVVDAEKAGLKPGGELRDLWRQKSLGTAGNDIRMAIPSHGVMLYKVK
ncbi:MAG: alpha-galactosidase, partial [Bacteroidetes bacterium HGW-Bacteroidetes-22]